MPEGDTLAKVAIRLRPALAGHRLTRFDAPRLRGRAPAGLPVSWRAHLVVIVLATLPAVFVLRLVRRRALRAKYSMLWLAVAAVLFLTALFPFLVDEISEVLGIDNPPAVYLMIAIVFLLMVVMHFSWELSRLEERTRTLAEELALLKATRPDDEEADA